MKYLLKLLSAIRTSYGSIFNLAGYDYFDAASNIQDESDAIRNHWQEVGNDIKRALSKNG